MSQGPETQAEYLARMGPAWNDSARAWMQWWPTFERGAGALSQRLVELARVQSGMRVLDLSTGVGEPALRLAQVVGAEGQVLATDLALSMLSYARERARAAKLTQLSFVAMEGEALALQAQSFDAATFRWGPMLMNDPVLALESARRVLKSGAWLACSVWCTGKEVPFIALPGLVAEEALGLMRPPAGTPGPLRMGREGELASALSSAGFQEIHVERQRVLMEFESPQHFARFHLELSSPMRAHLQRVPTDRERYLAALHSSVQPYLQPDGTLAFENWAYAAAARAP